MSNKHKFPFVCNICYLINNKGEVLLQKKRHGFGKGKWNGPGGKLKINETPEQSAIREIKEETNLDIINLKKAGEIEFVFTEDEKNNNFVHIFFSDNFIGEPEDLGEGELKWFKFEEIPYNLMWDDDKYWLPDALAGKYVNLRFYFDKNGKVLKYEKI